MRHHTTAVDGVLTPQFSRSVFLTTASPFDRQCKDQGKYTVPLMAQLWYGFRIHFWKLTRLESASSATNQFCRPVNTLSLTHFSFIFRNSI